MFKESGRLDGFRFCDCWGRHWRRSSRATPCESRQASRGLGKAIAPPTWTRPEILWPATTDTLFSLLPRATWEEDALLRLGGIDIWNGRRAIELISAATLHQIQIERWAADAVRMRERLLGLGTFELYRGNEVIAVLKEQNRIVGVRTRDIVTGLVREFLAPWTIGDDGVHSLVRQACGLDINTKMFPLDFLCFTFSWPTGLHPATGRVWLNIEESGSCIFGLFAVPLPQRGAGVVLVRPEIFETENLARHDWERFCAIDASLKEMVQERRFPDDFVRVRRPWGHAKRYGIEGAILMGDAAHPVSPAGGQGANMSVADARALVEIAVNNPSRLVEEYEFRRREANERSLRFTRGAARLLGLPACVIPISFVISIVRWANQHASVLAPIIRYESTAFQEKKR
jgi:2-polyprenyl-6-methoxyphenol hydroxylase-like FAD-dependent oxidoreductase